MSVASVIKYSSRSLRPEETAVGFAIDAVSPSREAGLPLPCELEGRQRPSRRADLPSRGDGRQVRLRAAAAADAGCACCCCTIFLMATCTNPSAVAQSSHATLCPIMCGSDRARKLCACGLDPSSLDGGHPFFCSVRGRTESMTMPGDQPVRREDDAVLDPREGSPSLR